MRACDQCGAAVPTDSSACAGCGYTSAALVRPRAPASASVAPAPKPAAEFDPFDSFETGKSARSGESRRPSRPLEPAALEGRILAGRFHVLELLGEGGMGRVYRALHLGLERHVAVKVLRAGLEGDPEVMRRFQREARSASRLRHPNAIQVLDFGVDDGAMYLVMELVEGRDLRQLLRAEGPLPEARVCSLLAQVLAALADAHAAQVVHRDLKPDNIMVERLRDGAELVKVLDFGIAKILEPDEENITAADVVCGTPQYMSPEQADGKPYDGRSDLYSVGVIAYQLLTGEQPIVGRNPLEVLRKQATERPTAPRLRRPDLDLSPALDALVMRALEKDPAKRPRTAEEFRTELLSLATRTPRSTAPAFRPVEPPPLDPPERTMLLLTSADERTLAPNQASLPKLPPHPALSPAPTRVLPATAEKTLLLPMPGAVSSPTPRASERAPTATPASPRPRAPAPSGEPPAAHRRRGGAPPNRDRPLLEPLAPEPNTDRGLPHLGAATALELAEVPRRPADRTPLFAAAPRAPVPSRLPMFVKQAVTWAVVIVAALAIWRLAVPRDIRSAIVDGAWSVVGVAR